MSDLTLINNSVSARETSRRYGPCFRQPVSCPAGGKTRPAPNSPAASLPHLSLYSFRYLWAGEFYLLHRQLKSLPTDMWQFYMEKAGRSGASHSYMTYVAAYTSLFATRVRYVTDVGRSMLAVSFKGSMLGW